MSVATHVRIDDAALAAFARRLAARTNMAPPAWDDGGWHYCADAPANGPLTAQYVLVLDALNWCFWPSPTDLEYDSLATGLRLALEADPHCLDAGRLAAVTEAEVSGWVTKPHVLPNLPERVARVREVGVVLGLLFDGKTSNLIAQARNSAVELVRLITAAFTGFRDEAVYRGRHVKLYKRVQIFVGDVWAAYGRQTCTKEAAAAGSAGSIYAFYDMDALTCFPDYRIPQLLRAEGVMVYGDALSTLVDAKQEIAAGSEMEVEIRAATVVAVERIREQLDGLRLHHWQKQRQQAGGTTDSTAPSSSLAPTLRPLTSVEVDWYLWQEGEQRHAKGELQPHHRVNTVFY